jgi:hypothetical protein
MKAIPMYRHPVMEVYYLGWWKRQYEFGCEHPLYLTLLKNSSFWLFFVGPTLAIPVFAGAFVSPSGPWLVSLTPDTRFLLTVCGAVLLGALLPVYFSPHYVAPITSAVYALIMIGMRKLWRWEPWGMSRGRFLARAVPFVAVLMLILCVCSRAIRDSYVPQFATWYSPAVVQSYRSEVIAQLSKQPGMHLVIVQYQPDHAPVNEWVFNGADIDRSKIVWARDMGREQNSELIRYFEGRRAWTVRPDVVPLKLEAYSGDSPADANSAERHPQ